MSRQPALTFAGALQVLGAHEPKAVRLLDKALGGLILAAGVGAGIAALGGDATPAAMFAALWTWTEQKNEAMTLLRDIIGRLGARTSVTAGRERRELIFAAHSIIVAAAFLDILRDELHDSGLTAAFPDWRAGDHAKAGHARAYFEALYLLEIPCPSGSWGFLENLGRVRQWTKSRFVHVEQQVAAAGLTPPPSAELIDRMAQRYESYYLELAATIPEFMVWVCLGESGATRERLAALDEFVRAAQGVNSAALARVEYLLSTHTRQGELTDLQLGLQAANQGVLRKPVVPSDTERYDTDVTFPIVGKVFLTPRYRVARYSRDARLADDRWWDQARVRDDLDHMIVSHVTAPDATRVPMVLLGHPGAGKSLFTEVLAARLPVSDYAVVRVPLRAVDSGAPIMAQLQQALNQATHNRVSWTSLAERCANLVPVVLLDGLDELLQATRHDRGNYLQDVAEFQRIEAEQGRPVVVVVTCRTVVIDRVVVSDETMVVKLEGFDDTQVRAWLLNWHDANAAAIATGRVRALTFDEAMHQPDLVTQPLLLLMLAVYAADPTSPALDAGLSQAALYERIFDNFARREVLKRARDLLRGRVLESAVREQLARLAIAALAMFNRGRQSADESEIRADLAALSRDSGVTEDAGARVLGEFFFVHAAEATSAERTARSYEFLHSTFGEYLVAHFVVLELRKVAAAAFGGRWPTGDIADELLFAVLSHHAWARRRSIVEFAVSIFEALPTEERAHVMAALLELVRTYRAKDRSPRFDSYAPVPRDAVRRLAAYSANLVTMAVQFAHPEQISLGDLFDDTSDVGIRNWHSALWLWRSGLYGNSWHAMVETLKLAGDSVGRHTQRLESVAASSAAVAELLFAELASDEGHIRRLRYGMAIVDQTTVFDPERGWEEYTKGWMILALAGASSWHRFEPIDPSPDQPIDVVERVGRDLEYTLRMCIGRRPGGWVENVVDSLLRYPPPYSVAVETMLTVAYFEPAVFARIAAFHDPVRYAGHHMELAFVFDHPHGVVPDRPTWRLLRIRLLGDQPRSAPRPEEIGRIIRMFTHVGNPRIVTSSS